MTSITELKGMEQSFDFGQWSNFETELPQIENQMAAFDSKIEVLPSQQYLHVSPPLGSGPLGSPTLGPAPLGSPTLGSAPQGFPLIRSMSSEKLVNKTYSDLIVEAIESHPQKRLTLAQIYEWMIINVPICRENANTTSSTGWKNCIRHNLSLHKEFQRIPSDTKNSFWYINYEELERKRSSKHATAGRKRARSFTNMMQTQGSDLLAARERARVKSMGTSQRPKLAFMRLHSHNELAVEPLGIEPSSIGSSSIGSMGIGASQFSAGEHIPSSIPEYMTMQDQSHRGRASSVVKFEIPGTQNAGLTDMELEKGKRLLNELNAMEAGRNVPKAEIERINYHIEAVKQQADKDWNNLVIPMMEDILKDFPNLDPFVDAMMTLDNFESHSSDQMVISP